MRRLLLDFCQAFIYGIFCVSLIAISLWFAKISETSPNGTTEASFEKIINSKSPAYLDLENIFVSGGSTLSFSSQEKNKNQIGACDSIFGYLSFNEYQSFFIFQLRERLKFTNILDHLHNSYFFF